MSVDPWPRIHTMAGCPYRRSGKATSSLALIHETDGGAAWRDRYRSWRLSAFGWRCISAIEQRTNPLYPQRLPIIVEDTSYKPNYEGVSSWPVSHHGICLRPPPPSSSCKAFEKRKTLHLLALSAADLVLKPAALHNSSPLIDRGRDREPYMFRPPAARGSRIPFSRAAAIVANRVDLIDGKQSCSTLGSTNLSLHVKREPLTASVTDVNIGADDSNREDEEEIARMTLGLAAERSAGAHHIGHARESWRDPEWDGPGFSPVASTESHSEGIKGARHGQGIDKKIEIDDVLYADAETSLADHPDLLFSSGLYPRLYKARRSLEKEHGNSVGNEAAPTSAAMPDKSASPSCAQDSPEDVNPSPADVMTRSLAI